MIRIFQALAAFVAAGLLAGAVAAADLKAGVQAYQAGNYKRALREFEALAKSGNAHAEFNLAILYLTGRGVEKDIVRSIALHRRAAAKGLIAAQHGLGVLHYQGVGVKQDFSKALEWFRKSAAQGFADSAFNIGVMYFNSQGVERDEAEVVKWVSLAASKGFAPAEFRLGQMYEKGIIFEQNLKEALHWYRLSSGHGNKKAAASLVRVARELGMPAEAPSRVPAPSDKEEADKPEPATLAEPQIPQASGSEETPQSGTAKERETKLAETPPAKPKEESRLRIPEPPRKPDMNGSPKKAKEKPEPGVVAKKPGSVAASSMVVRREWRIQFASFRTAAMADREWDTMGKGVTEALGDTPKVVSPVDLGDRGVFHRLQAGPFANRSLAVAACARVKAVAPTQSCLPIRVRAN